MGLATPVTLLRQLHAQAGSVALALKEPRLMAAVSVLERADGTDTSQPAEVVYDRLFRVLGRRAEGSERSYGLA